VKKKSIDEHPSSQANIAASQTTSSAPSTKKTRSKAVTPSTAVLDAPRRFDEMNDQSRRYFRLSVTTGWKKLNVYYTKLGESPLYTAAIVLHPGFGLAWLESRWSDHRSWIREAHGAIREYWKRWYQRDDEAVAAAVQIVQQQAQLTSNKVGDSDGEFDQFMYEDHRTVHSIELEIDRNLEESPVPGVNPIAWWLANREKYPKVSQFALVIFAIPAMAADCERAFSLAKLTLSGQKLSMAPLTLEHLQCLKN
jgi:hypothetical protein